MALDVVITFFFPAENLQATREWYILSAENRKTYNLGYSTQQIYHSEFKERERTFQASKN